MRRFPHMNTEASLGDEQRNVVSACEPSIFIFGGGEGGTERFDSGTFFISLSLCAWKTKFIP